MRNCIVIKNGLTYIPGKNTTSWTESEKAIKMITTIIK